MDQTPAAAPQPTGQTPPPPQVIVIQQPAAPVGKPKSSRIKRVFIGCVIGVAVLAGAGKLAGMDPGVFGGSNPGPVITAPAPTPTPTAPAPLSHVAPKVLVEYPVIAVHPNVGNQSWVDVTVTPANMGNAPVQMLTITLMQNGKPVTITDPGGWSAYGNGVMLPQLGIGESLPVTLRVESWTPNVPITVVVGGNGVANSATMPTVSCPTANSGENIGCQSLGG